MTLQEVERRKVATQWDGGWFCDKCERLVHWKTKAYMFGKQCLCHSCAEEKIKKMNKTLDKSKIIWYNKTSTKER